MRASSRTAAPATGAGTGATSFLLAALGAKSVTAIEVKDASCAAIELVADAYSLPIGVVHASLNNLNDPRLGLGNLFDVVVAFGVLAHISDPLGMYVYV